MSCDKFTYSMRAIADLIAEDARERVGPDKFKVINVDLHAEAGEIYAVVSYAEIDPEPES